MTWDEELDAIGLLCPLPVLKARKRLLAMAEGTVLVMRADDPAAIVDVPHFCSEAGHEDDIATQRGRRTAIFHSQGRRLGLTPSLSK